ncbi:MAG: hypothetical protein UU09_C0046G0016 [Microgenomates group bacterium GW2011_GWA2_40_6]|nr:MAG: hypothetical protein UU09_C0046G0016 [Microgenomates group bacterium GW2011_GWA2_40_6]
METRKKPKCRGCRNYFSLGVAIDSKDLEEFLGRPIEGAEMVSLLNSSCYSIRRCSGSIEQCNPDDKCSRPQKRMAIL